MPPPYIMKTILLAYLPFCTPATPPYSITYLYSFLKANSGNTVKVLDLNLEFHKLKFPEFQKYYKEGNWKEYDAKTAEYKKISSKVYYENNRKVVDGEKPELFEELLNQIKEAKPDIVAFSIVYSSQAFFAYALMKEMKQREEFRNIQIILGGPSVNEKIIALADKTLKNEIELLNFVEEKEFDHEDLNFNIIPDFSQYNLSDYFTPHPIIPVRTSNTCYYKQCAFCSHYLKADYLEFPIEMITKTITASKQKYFFLIDDMIPPKRLLKLAEAFRPLDIRWCVQLRPTKEFTHELLKTLKESGLTMIMWGVESGNDRVLKLIRKGTNVKDVEKVLENSRTAGIRNITYILFGFPGETKEEFLDTIEFLKKNKENIDLVSTSIFGLQYGTHAYTNSEEFGITIIEEERTVLEPRLTYTVKNGLTQKEAARLKDNHRRTLESINKFPKNMNFFREHMFCSL